MSPSVTALGREAGDTLSRSVEQASILYLASTESIVGPGPRASAALLAHYAADPTVTPKARLRDADLRAAIARRHGATTATVVTGAGSTELLRNATRAFTSSSRPLVTAAPSFLACRSAANQLGTPVVEVPLTTEGAIDLEALAEAARGAGLVYLCNPNNPTGTVHGAESISAFVARVRSESPETHIAIDEAYHDYVTDPTDTSAITLALATPRVLVTRSFSKAHGLAGLRLGYAVASGETITTLARHVMPNATNVMAIGPALAALEDEDHLTRERARNAAARTFTSEAFTRMGCKVAVSQANFVFVRVGMAAAVFRDACAARDVAVGRDFPPLADAWARISIATIEEMRRAAAVFETVLTHRRASHATQARERSS